MSESLAPETTLWRYMDFTRFVSLFLDQSLFFCRVDQLDDPFEGNITRIEYEYLMNKEEPEWEDYRNTLSELYKLTRETVYVNCWHSDSRESAAMWSLYSGQYDGVAIKTDFQSLKTSIEIEHLVLYDKISYRDYNKFPYEHEIAPPYLSKQIEFEHEKEVRAYKHGDYPDVKGIPVPVDIGVLVKEVVVAPYAKGWFVDLVESIVHTSKSKATVSKSQLANAPDF
ncbi:DUF2971 domain-containing protein [Candidatus Poriferisocius sp.]|uniref:DUF2971 domain-containing protein n=1 Tax=Candidatus Poriferisocius sp. TaxID=3101276 RepID=UPI003B01D288